MMIRYGMQSPREFLPVRKPFTRFCSGYTRQELIADIQKALLELEAEQQAERGSDDDAARAFTGEFGDPPA